MNFSFNISVQTRGIAVTGEALVSSQSLKTAEADLRVALMTQARDRNWLRITPRDDAPPTDGSE